MPLQIREDESRLTDSDMARIIERIFVALEYGFLDWDAVLPPTTGVETVTATAPVVSTGGSDPVISLSNAGITLALMANLATDRLIGRVSLGTGVPEAVVFTDAGQALVDDADAAAQRTTLGLGTLATQSGTFSGTSSGTNTGDQTITLTGEVTGSGTGSFATTVAATHSGSAHHAAYTHPNHSGEVTSVGDGAQTVVATHSGSAHHAESHTLTSHSTRAHSELTGVGAGDHHAQAHALSGADHTGALAVAQHGALGAIVGAHAHTDLSGVSADQHHTQSHTHASHTGIGATDHHTNANDPTAGEKTWLTNGLAGQVAFPATQNASGGANVLDDYEEGTWTPGITFGGGSAGVTYGGANAGGYVKIGRHVFLGGLLQLSSKGTSTGSAALTGLPFAASGTSVGRSVAVPGLSGVTFNAYPWLSSNAATPDFQETSTAGSQSALTDADFTNSSAVSLAFSYQV